MTAARPQFRSLAAGLLFAAIASLGACGDEVTSQPLVPGPLTAGTWYMHTANGLDLPAEISRRFVGLVDEQIVLDSSRIVVVAGGTWQQRYWTRVFHIGVLDRSEFVLDEGTWVLDGPAYDFTSTLRPRTFSVVVDSPTRVTSTEPMVFFANAPAVTGVYRTTAP